MDAFLGKYAILVHPKQRSDRGFFCVRLTACRADSLALPQCLTYGFLSRKLMTWKAVSQWLGKPQVNDLGCRKLTTPTLLDGSLGKCVQIRCYVFCLAANTRFRLQLSVWGFQMSLWHLICVFGYALCSVLITILSINNTTSPLGSAARQSEFRLCRFARRRTSK